MIANQNHFCIQIFLKVRNVSPMPIDHGSLGLYHHDVRVKIIKSLVVLINMHTAYYSIVPEHLMTVFFEHSRSIAWHDWRRKTFEGVSKFELPILPHRGES